MAETYQLKHTGEQIDALLDKAGVTYQPLNADAERELVAQYGVKQAPTLVVVKNGEVSKYAGVSDIKKFLGV